MTRDTPEAAVWALMKQGWRIKAPGGSDVPPPAFLAALDGWTLVPRRPGSFSYEGALQDAEAEIARLRAALLAICRLSAAAHHLPIFAVTKDALAPAPSEP
jgi:hypothetical protein